MEGKRVSTTVDLSDPNTEFVRLVGMWGGDLEINMFKIATIVKMNIEMLVWIDATDSVDANGPDGSRYG